MGEKTILRLIEHNNWANLQIYDACSRLTENQLDYQPQSAVRGTIRETLQHVALSQEDYATMLTQSTHPPERTHEPTLTELRSILKMSGDVLIAFVQNASEELLQAQNPLSDGYKVNNWAFIVQTINHATEHREQIKHILTALGIEPPRIDGWEFAKEQNALIPPQ